MTIRYFVSRNLICSQVVSDFLSGLGFAISDLLLKKSVPRAAKKFHPDKCRMDCPYVSGTNYQEQKIKKGGRADGLTHHGRCRCLVAGRPVSGHDSSSNCEEEAEE
jgi:hypothetical protein